VAGANNLTRDEARERSRLLSVDSYEVDLDFSSATADAPTFSSRSRIRFRCAEPGAETFVDVTADRITGMTLNAGGVVPEHDGHRVRLSGLAAENELVVEADCAYMGTGEGLHRFADPVDGAVYLYTHFETFDAHRMFACFDQPDLKAAFTFRVVAPADWVVVSNTAGQVADAGRGRVLWTFEPTAPISTYITAVVAGPYHEVRSEHDGIPLGIYCRRSLAEFLDPERIFRETAQGFDFFHRHFGYRYPFGKYDQCFVPEFNMGAMENAGCVTFLEDYVFRSKVTRARYEFRCDTILHELAHMWFGNLVTMRWWNDLWLNESFASYVSVLACVEATEYTTAWTTFADVEKTKAYRQDQLSTTHPIVADIPDIEAVNVNFDWITYSKGAAVLKQLVAWVGRDAFFAGMNTYFRRHEYGNTTLADLLTALAEASGRDLSMWSKEWLQTAGVNTLRPEPEVGTDGTYTAFSVVQEAPPDHPTLRSHRVAIGLYDRTGDGLQRRHRVELDVEGPVTDVPDLVGVPEPDLVVVNDDDLTYAKVRFDRRSLATLTDHIAELRDSLPRSLCWTAAWDMTRDAELGAGDYLRMVVAGAPSEPDVGLVQTLLGQALAAVDHFSVAANRAERRQRLAELALDQLPAAEPGSDHQLIWCRAFASAATAPAHVDLLRDLLAGSHEYPGLNLDPELRWHLLRRLAALGRAADAEIGAELARDQTAAGRRHALAARAAQPTPEAKAAAWAAAVDSDELHNAEQRAVVSGFMQPEQRELLRPYRERYFEVVGPYWAARTHETAVTVVTGLYPTFVDEPETVAMTDDYIRRHQPPPALARLLTEGRDGLQRALRAQARDS
jgi:aminopeptidase N